MNLWTEYEGRTIAGVYPLRKLLRSEGRNGFFATSNSTGESAVIRLTESHFDEEEVLKRWRQVAELHQDNLIGIERVGQTTFDGVALTYALMERNDANLDDVLKERPLTTAETLEVAKSVLAAVSVLHASGLVHEHIEPLNVLAVGEVVKLRSDCVRECVADGEFTSAEACEELRKRDIHDFGVLLLRCLTLEKELTSAQKLPEPFKRIIPGAMDGTLSLAQIGAVLNPPYTAAKTAVGTNGNHAPAAPGATATPATPTRPAAAAPVRPATAVPAAAVLGSEPSSLRPDAPIRVRSSYPSDVDEEPTRSLFRTPWVIGLAAVIVLLLGWRLLAHKSAPAATAPTAPVAQSAPPPQAEAPATSGAPAPAPAATSPGEAAAAAPMATGHTGAGWYVIAYTYNHEVQARTKATRLERRHGGFRPEVFSPSGHAPYLVSLGGPLTQEEAVALERRARRSGMPRDTFIRRY